VSTYERYRQYALDCLGLANKTNDLSTKTLLVDMPKRGSSWRSRRRRMRKVGRSMKRPLRRKSSLERRDDRNRDAR